jgi:hypothetical protein
MEEMRMPRSNIRSVCRDNAVIRHLKKGSGKIAGLKMLVAVDGRALFPVVVTGLDFYARHDSNGGVSVRVRPAAGGHGHIWVAPGELLDDTPQAVAMHELKCEAHDRVRSVVNSRSDKERRSALLTIRSEMTDAQKKDFASRIADRLGDKATADPVAAINRMSGEYEFRRVAEVAVTIRYKLDEMPDDSHSYD